MATWRTRLAQSISSPGARWLTASGAADCAHMPSGHVFPATPWHGTLPPAAPLPALTPVPMAVTAPSHSMYLHTRKLHAHARDALGRERRRAQTARTHGHWTHLPSACTHGQHKHRSRHKRMHACHIQGRKRMLRSTRSLLSPKRAALLVGASDRVATRFIVLQRGATQNLQHINAPCSSGRT